MHCRKSSFRIHIRKGAFLLFCGDISFDRISCSPEEKKSMQQSTSLVEARLKNMQVVGRKLLLCCNIVCEKVL
jgi:hypothetical protein